MTNGTKQTPRRVRDRKLAAVAELACFSGCSAATLRRLGSLFDWVEVPAGRTIESSRPGSAWLSLVLEGEVVTTDQDTPVIVYRSHCWGHQAFFEASASSSPAVALTSVTLLVIGRAAWGSLVQVTPTVAAMLRQMPHRDSIAQCDRAKGDTALIRLALAS
jgi:CRP-like cAMP-binding protein